MDALPSEILILIFSKLPISSVRIVLSLNKYFYKFNDDDYLWKIMLMRDFPYDIVNYNNERDRRLSFKYFKYDSMINKYSKDLKNKCMKHASEKEKPSIYSITGESRSSDTHRVSLTLLNANLENYSPHPNELHNIEEGHMFHHKVQSDSKSFWLPYREIYKFLFFERDFRWVQYREYIINILQNYKYNDFPKYNINLSEISIDMNKIIKHNECLLIIYHRLEKIINNIWKFENKIDKDLRDRRCQRSQSGLHDDKSLKRLYDEINFVKKYYPELTNDDDLKNLKPSYYDPDKIKNGIIHTRKQSRRHHVIHVTMLYNLYFKIYDKLYENIIKNMINSDIPSKGCGLTSFIEHLSLIYKKCYINNSSYNNMIRRNHAFYCPNAEYEITKNKSLSYRICETYNY